MSVRISKQMPLYTYPAGGAVQRISSNTEALLELLAELRLRQIPFVIALESEVVDRVGEVVAVAIRFQVRHKLIEAVGARAERATGGEVNVANDLVHAHTTSDVASLGRLLFELFGPALLHAL